MSTDSAHAQDEARWSNWIAAANNGDKATYQQLLQEIAGATEAYVRHRFGNVMLLEDCVQESLLAIHNARHTYDSARPFRPWMFTIIRQKTIDLLRKSRTISENEKSAAPGEPDNSAMD